MPTLAATSGRRESNPRPRAWKARALPTELLPRRILFPSFARSLWRGEDSNLRRRSPADLQSAPFGHSGTSPRPSRPRRRADGRSRTGDLLITSQPLYRLSYIGTSPVLGPYSPNCAVKNPPRSIRARLPIGRGEKTRWPPLTKRRLITSGLGAVNEKNGRPRP